MRLTILGGHGTFPVAGGCCSGYLLEHDGFKLWMDAGNGTLGKLQEHWNIEDVDAIWISHAHPDHCSDLYPFFFWAMNQEVNFKVFAPSGVKEKLGLLIGEDSLTAWATKLEWHELDPGGSTKIGPFKAAGFSSQHSTPNTALRLEAAGKVLAYSGDSGPDDGLVECARDADVFLCEASWVDPKQVFAPIHLLASEAGEHAKRAGAKRLVLTHVWSCNDMQRVKQEASDAFGAPAELAIEIETTEI